MHGGLTAVTEVLSPARAGLTPVRSRPRPRLWAPSLVAGVLALMVVVLGVVGSSSAAASTSDGCYRPCHGELETHGEEPYGSSARCFHGEACAAGAGASSAVPFGLTAALGAVVPPLAGARRSIDFPPGSARSTVGSGIDHPPRPTA